VVEDPLDGVMEGVVDDPLDGVAEEDDTLAVGGVVEIGPTVELIELLPNVVICPLVEPIEGVGVGNEGVRLGVILGRG